MNLYQVTIEGDTETWQAESLPDAIELAFEDQVRYHFHEEDLASPTFDKDNLVELSELKGWFEREGLEAVVHIGELANP